ncbi:MAG: DUF5005 domain-containing protein [Cyanobacteria bacterium]|nr:DUF5005 domain-containing protein [Cyanobacteriota bacterium]
MMRLGLCLLILLVVAADVPLACALPAQEKSVLIAEYPTDIRCFGDREDANPVLDSNCSPAEHDCDLSIVSSKPYQELTSQFKQNTGWVGGDAAYSISLSKGRTFWTFGDTWIGRIENGRRVGCKMINNSAALQDIPRRRELGNKSRSNQMLPLGKLKFLWRRNETGAASLFSPNTGRTYFWPADGVSINGELYLFLREIETDKSKPAPFQFDTVKDAAEINKRPDEIQFANACLVDGDYILQLSAGKDQQ